MIYPDKNRMSHFFLILMFRIAANAHDEIVDFVRDPLQLGAIAASGEEEVQLKDNESSLNFYHGLEAN